MGINATYIQGYATSIVSIINGILVPVLISIAFIVFLWGVYKYFILGADSETERTAGKTFALYGIIGFVILFSLWGIVQIFMGTLGLTASNVPTFPSIGNVTSGSTNTTSSTGSTAAQTQAAASTMSKANSAYSTCVAQKGVSNCTAEASALLQAQDTYLSAGGSPSGIPGWGVSCTGSGVSTCNPGLSCIYNICTSSSSSAGTSGSGTASDDAACATLYSEEGTCSATKGCTLNSSGSCVSTSIEGCTDSSASNYNQYANVNDGSCTYESGCTDSTASNYNKDATTNDGSCTYNVAGCTDSKASNYDPSATFDDGSCAEECYAPTADTCSDGCVPDPNNTEESFSCVPAGSISNSVQ